MIPCRLDRSLRRAQRFHELHKEMGRQLEQRFRIDKDGATVLFTSFNLCARNGTQRSSGGETSRGQGGFFEECSSFQGRILSDSYGTRITMIAYWQRLASSRISLGGFDPSLSKLGFRWRAERPVTLSWVPRQEPT